MQRRRIIGLSSLVIAVGGIAIAFAWPHPMPFRATVTGVAITNDVASAQSAKTLTVRFTNLGSNYVSFRNEQHVRYRVAGRWQSPQTIAKGKMKFIRPGPDDTVVALNAPPAADACQLGLDYTDSASPRCQAILNMPRSLNRFPTVRRWILNCFPMQATVHHAEIELPLPASAPHPLDSASVNPPLTFIVNGRP